MFVFLILGILFIGIGGGIYDPGFLGVGIVFFVIWLFSYWVKDANSPEGRKRANKLTREQKKFENEYGVIDYRDKDKD